MFVLKVKNIIRAGLFFWGLISGAASATTYYVDCEAASNGSGTSQGDAWNTTNSINSHGAFSAGDSILFKRGASCTLPAGPGNEISPRGSGTSSSPVTLGDYAAGALPVIEQNGNTSIIKLDNLSYWVVEDIELRGNDAVPGGGAQRRGINVLATSANVYGITISNVTIKDVVGQDAKFAAGSAGILFYNRDELGHEFHNILIVGNTLDNVHRGGIEFATAVQSEVSPSNPSFTLNPARKSTNVVIRNNRLSQIGGDGIVLDGTDGAIVENNVLDQIAIKSTANNVAIWSRNSINSLFQSNVISNTQQHPGTSDGQSLDADWWGFNNIFQYNLSKGNQGGFALLCTNPASGLSATEQAYIPSGSSRAIFRYNISINDGYNNGSVFPDKGRNARSWFTNCFLDPEGIEFYNNVFLC